MLQDDKEKFASFQRHFQSVKEEILVTPRYVSEEAGYFRSFLHFSTNNFRTRKFLDIENFANG